MSSKSFLVKALLDWKRLFRTWSAHSSLDWRSWYTSVGLPVPPLSFSIPQCVRCVPISCQLVPVSKLYLLEGRAWLLWFLWFQSAVVSKTQGWLSHAWYVCKKNNKCSITVPMKLNEQDYLLWSKQIQHQNQNPSLEFSKYIYNIFDISFIL